jgi:hypothetical protein
MTKQTKPWRDAQGQRDPAEVNAEVAAWDFRLAAQVRAYALLREQCSGWLRQPMFVGATVQELRAVADRYEKLGRERLERELWAAFL